jgi:hypothetical protein
MLGLAVRNLADGNGGAMSGDVVIAVAGWYSPRTAQECPPRIDVDRRGFVEELGVVADTATFCRRAGVLYARRPEAGTPDPTDEPIADRVRMARAAISVEIGPGVIVTPGLEDIGGRSVDVILVGRRIERGTPRCSSSHCPTDLIVDRVVWAEGMGRPQTTSIVPGLLDTSPLLSWRPRDRLAEATLGPTGAILLETLVDPATLAEVDPAAAAAVAVSAPGAKRIWYRRALGPDPAGDEPRWVAIDDATGSAIASGLIGGPAFR